MGKKWKQFSGWVMVAGFLFVPSFLFAQEATPVVSVLTFQTEGRVSFLLTTPSGEKVGIESGVVYQQATNTETSFVFETQGVTFTEPRDGEYTVSFYSQYTEEFSAFVQFFSTEDGGGQAEFGRFTKTGPTNQITFSLKNNEVVFPSVWEYPQELKAKKVSGKTKLVWSEVQGATAYKIYYKEFNTYPYYTFLGTTTETTYFTSYVWASEGTHEKLPNDLVFFKVSAVSGEGEETNMSQAVSNDDEDGDGLVDWKEAGNGTSRTKFDTDGDGLGDFFEINRTYTDPLNEDTDGDGYLDGHEFASGTSAIHASSTPFIPEVPCEAPGSGDWLVQDDCDVKTNQNVPADIIISSNALMTIYENVVLSFDFLRNKILIMFGGGLKLKEGARFEQND